MSHPQLAPLHEWTIEYLKGLPTTELEWLDFKQSAWLKTDEMTFNKLSAYVSAFANYSGGYLVIGCKNPQPGIELEFDEGVDFSMKNGIQGWLEDKIPGLVDPPVSSMSVQPIPFDAGDNFGIVVIRIEPSSDAPHQARDKIFYQRVGSKNKGLGTQHIMDIRNRRKHPEVSVSLALNVFEHEDDDDPAGFLRWEVENLTDVFCRHIAIVMKAPTTLEGKALIYPDGELGDDPDRPGIKVIRVSAGNALSPLFPRGKLRGKISVRLANGTWKQEHVTSDSFEVRAYADGAPAKNFTILQSDIATIRFHPRRP